MNFDNDFFIVLLAVFGIICFWFLLDVALNSFAEKVNKWFSDLDNNKKDDKKNN